MVIICPGTLLNISNWYPVILRRTYYKPWRFLIAQNDIQEKIKKPPNAFVLFVLKMKETLPDSCRGKRIITPELGKMWNELPEDEKEKYREQYRQGMAKTISE
ncbi:UNVERIFIED_CONTAM: hypothetical protein PYX00_002630 [Menopon gallinae]|uniref:HMG box domain-containing protein n=1 Tax=Menopon gallinae TaxID=328185 RepID=A0AAW2HXZ9_9NEOP